MRRLTLIAVCFLVFACSEAPLDECDECPQEGSISHESDAYKATEQSEEAKYPGASMASVFPVVSSISTIDDNGADEYAELTADDYSVKVKHYLPMSLSKNGQDIFKFRGREIGGYWATGMGISALTGPAAKEVYVVVSGPAAVCCTNYSIIDVSSAKPKSIFHSEEFGSFRDPMEVFDAEGDGVYEIMQFDTCFRYFMDDCGSCTPQPRAYFKFDPRSQRYLPAIGVLQDFVRTDLESTENWIAERSEELKQTGDLKSDVDFRRTVLSHVADLLHIGERSRAWRIFDNYYDDPNQAARNEIKARLAACKFY